MTPEQIIRYLLETFNEVRDPVFGRSGGGSGECPHMPSEWHSGSYAQLEQALKEMRSRAKQEAIAGVPLGTLWWHIVQRYLMSEQKVVWMVGKRDVESIVCQRRCICGYKFSTRTKARRHVEKVHKPRPVKTTICPAEYMQIGVDRRLLCESLGVGWIKDWFEKQGISPRLPVEKAA
ncbi:MAG: hypothetical protein WC565_03045 [Parcubacteria group bacterium]